MMENNIGGAGKNALAKTSRSATTQKFTESGPSPHQEMEESPSHQVRKLATREKRI